ncbi:helix-turn-helix domain-containing protein [uncultured Dokdonia sp.]|uniref:helix-turn-helix domain-containing protein n=1 Tax=uncultured Dokdonia sp. TaxID=575653 RepID=UPI002614272B|nr:helix-turn-helix domain-containing protein [uncultured Dokdonia sp.]
MIKDKFIITFFLTILGYNLTYAQVSDKREIQKLTEKSYKDLSETFLTLESKNDTLTIKLYAEAFLLKAKKENNIIKKADAYYMLADMFTRTSKNEQALVYADSIITITKDKNDYNYPAKAHLLKAKILGSQSNFQDSMNELAEANNYANTNENEDQQYQIKYFIAILKNNLGQNEESLKLFKSVVEYYEKKYLENKEHENEYIRSLYAYGSVLNTLEKYDSVQKINDKAIHLSLKTKDSSYYNRLLLSSAAVHYNKKEYKSSLDSIRKLQKLSSSKKSDDATNNTINFFLGRTFYKQKKVDSSLHYLLKVDSFAFKNNFFFPSIRENYELLIQHYKKEENIEKQLFYIDRLLLVDSILDNDVKYLSSHINEEYSKPNLILEKQQIIESLEKNNITKIVVLVILSVFVLLLMIIIIRNKKKQKIYQKRFQELLENKKSSETTTTKEKETQSIIENEPKDIGISEIIVNDILKNLEKFEENNDFLQASISVASLSKRFKTNSKYLSKVINVHKDKSFSNYINELRINYVIEELKVNSTFRRYTIRAIANEIGFNTTEAFSKSFYKTTGIYPSFFMKQLEKQEISKKHKI